MILFVCLSGHCTTFKVMPWHWAFSPNRYESDLLNEVMYVFVGQEAAKISEVKVGGQ